MTRRALAPAPPKKPRDRKPPPKPSPEARRAALVRILAEALLDEMLREATPNSRGNEPSFA